ncbi:endonuclease MutS2 [Miltoncostaea marina]|uniref:endonuclease MutS2 n=1 Tax=Miltoncostaea marina TaxID=2843215 RepID=UPI001C3C9E62|nr:Smr/MutS family protein [Miltoncostaea marina]
MDPRSAELLELPAVRERLAGLTAFAGGRALALGLTPSDDAREVARRVAETEEAVALRDLGVGGPGGASDIRDAVAQAARGAALDAPALLEVLVTVRVWLELAEALAGHRDAAPGLAEIVTLPDAGAARRIEAALDRAIDPRGGLLDSASAELASVRRRLAGARRAAADLLRDLAVRLRPHLQESFTTLRGGRPVLAVKASARSAVPGIVHDSSGSGETLFIEPMALVEANNLARQLAAQEAAEEERVLRVLSRAVGEERATLDHLTEALARLDLALAGAALSRAWEGCRVEPAAEVDLRAARHPLLEPSRAVPIDLPLAGVRALVVSGPNTGGKTVALKTLGLLAMLHQCGLRVPAASARMPVFDRVLADIGDDQSIAESLSTFSAHVKRLIAVMAAAGPRSLVLLDEPAAGTDPDEGARLAQAVVERLVEQGALVLATTHHPEMKAWASAAPRAANAAVGLDARTLRPLYQLQIGEPGASHALGIAEGLGLDPAVVEAARAAGPPERRALEALLAEASAARAAADEELEAARAARAAAEAAEAAALERARELERRVASVREGAEAERAAARERAERELAGLTRELADLRASISAARREEAARAGEARAPAAPAASPRARERDRRLHAASRAAARAREALAPPAPAEPAIRVPVAVGDHVVDPLMGFRGRVVAIDGDRAEVQGGAARMRLPLARLEHDRRAARDAERESRRAAEPAPSPVVPGAAPSLEVDLRGRRADDARDTVRERMDAAAMAGLPLVRVIHGHGTGALRQVVREELARHPLVARAEPAPPEEGGDGATIAYFTDEA